MDWSGQGPFWGAMGIAASVGLVILGLTWWRTARAGRRRFVDESRAYLKGVHYLLSDNPDAAIEELTRVVRVNTETIETYFALGALFRRKGEIERAIRIHQNILLRPGLAENTRAEARFQLALDYRKAGMLRQAKDAFASVVERSGERRERLAEAFAHLRDVHLEAGEHAEAVEAQRRRMKVSEHDEGHILAHLLAALARHTLDLGELDEARDAVKEALGTDPDCVDAHLTAAHLATEQGDYKAAQRHYDGALERRPEAVVLAEAQLAELFFRRGQYETLGDYLREWVGRHPDVASLRLALARYLRKRGLTEMAVEELRTALEMEPGFHDARQELGRILLEKDMGEELRRQYEALLEAMASEPTFRCGSCGHAFPELLWRCPRCGAWDSVNRHRPEPQDPAKPDPAA